MIKSVLEKVAIVKDFKNSVNETGVFVTVYHFLVLSSVKSGAVTVSCQLSMDKPDHQL